MPVIFLLALASAPPNGCCAGSGAWYENRSRLLAAPVCALSAPAATFYVTIVGTRRRSRITTQRFKMWADDIDGSLKKAGGDTNVTTMHAPTREQIRARFAELAKQAKPTDSLVVILIGHGTYDGHGLQVQHPGSGHHGAELAVAAGQDPGAAAAGGEHDQLQRRIDRAFCGGPTAS